MEIYHRLEHIRNRPAVVLAIGSFDGLHRGHIEIMETVRREAKQRGVKSMIITFAPTPREVLSGKKEIALMKPEEKIERIEASGIDLLCIRRFDKAFAEMGREKFIECLLTCLDLKALVAGPDHHVGKEHRGGIDYLRKTGKEHDFDLLVVGKARWNNEDISSQLIRKKLKEGRVEEANDMLGYTYRLSGTVVSGARRGRSLGFPTLNIEPDYPAVLIPAYGVYCAAVDLAGERYPAVCNIGVRPTFAENTFSLEVHVIGEELGSLYGKPIGISFERFLRGEKKFENDKALREQIRKDIKECKK